MNRTAIQLSFWLLFKAFIIAIIVLYSAIGLGPDEAQYWTWSQKLDFGYYSKPPGIAWQIALGTSLFGQTEFGVRFFSILLSIFQGLMLYYCAREVKLSQQAAFWCALCFVLSPLGILGSFFAITDVAVLFCWTAACYCLMSALSKQKIPSSLWIGLWLLIGALFKWPIYLFWVFFFIFRYWFFQALKWTDALKGVCLSLLGLLPSLWWNFSHNWPTFRHVLATIQGGSGDHPAPGNPFSFLGAQMALLSPILFLLLVLALVEWIRRRKQISSALFACGFMTISLLVVAVIVASFQKVQGNWMIFAYPTGCVLLAWDAFENHFDRKKWLKIGVVVSIVLMSVFLTSAFLYTQSSFVTYAKGYRYHPLKHHLGLHSFEEALMELGYQPDEDFLVSDKYQTTSLLSFYNTSKKRAYFLNLQEMRNNQFSYWPSLQEEQQQKKGYFISIENSPNFEDQEMVRKETYEKKLKAFFERVIFLKKVPLIYEGSRVVKVAYVFECENCDSKKEPLSDCY